MEHNFSYMIILFILFSFSIRFQHRWPDDYAVSANYVIFERLFSDQLKPYTYII